MRRVHSMAAGSLMFSFGLPPCGFTLGFSESCSWKIPGREIEWIYETFVTSSHNKEGHSFVPGRFHATVFCLGSQLLIKASGNKFFCSCIHIGWHHFPLDSVVAAVWLRIMELHHYYCRGYWTSTGSSSLFGDEDDDRYINNVHNRQWNGNSNW